MTSSTVCTLDIHWRHTESLITSLTLLTFSIIFHCQGVNSAVTTTACHSTNSTVMASKLLMGFLLFGMSNAGCVVDDRDVSCTEILNHVEFSLVPQR